MPDPLHPAVVHFPLALALLLPLLAALAAAAQARGLADRSLWAGLLLLHGVLAGSAWIAVESGEDEEERVEEVVDHAVIHEHEEAAEWLLWLAWGTLPFTAAGLLRGRAGAWARIATVGLAVGVAAAAVRTGALGGALVYEHGAAAAYTAPAPPPSR